MRGFESGSDGVVPGDDAPRRGSHGRPHESGETRGRGRGRRRFFEGSELRLVLLLLIAQEPRHGYDLIREIESRSGGGYAPSPGVIYPTLTLLDEMGQVDAGAWEASKKRYAITDAGRSHLAERHAEAEAALARLEGLRARSETIEKGPVFRAMNNLKVALRGRLDETSDKETLFSIADIIDEAARRIERL
jgi:DNA-binding PadR family transcriptional regulator